MNFKSPTPTNTKMTAKPSDTSKNPDYLYFNLSTTNIQGLNGVQPPILNIDVTRTQPFLENSEMYDLSIVRFLLNTSTIPIFIPIIKLNTTDPNETIYSVTLTYTDGSGNYAQEYVEYIPKIKTIPVPAKVNGSFQNNTQEYYNIYSYTWWIYLVQNAFQAAFTALQIAVVNAGGTLPSSYAPVIAWDTQTNCAVLYVPETGYDDSGTGAQNILIYMNQPLFNLFSTFPFVVNSYSTSVNGTNFRIATSSIQNNSITQYPPSNPTFSALVIMQEASTVAIMNPVQYIGISSSSLNVVSTGVSSPTLYYNGNNFTGQGENNNIVPLVTDFGGAGNIRPFLIYEPTAEYRMISMVSTGSLIRLNFTINWVDNLNNFYHIDFQVQGVFQ